ncbi:uncharacterized protein F5147DRAFT_841564 [Suillus discolor]|uniref:Uncharacterized protein n=1 Tax=Suillus discolor TaxID=1912936 RepID=A0A9P7ESU9_9AGAM|nr:uncharacterized protein F5147DRAFT_841564 [Suillus discolor]KAG2086539.1 hypothetical protein F5147DRAFT_841564 [Suillus discolor]
MYPPMQWITVASSARSDPPNRVCCRVSSLTFAIPQNGTRLGPSTGSTIGDCFRVLIQSHVLYLASFVGASCLHLAVLSPEISNSISTEAQMLGGVLQILSVVQMFVLGPRLILSIRECHVKLVTQKPA